MRNRLKVYLQISCIACIVMIIDQFTKYVIRQNLGLRETWMPLEWLKPYARIIHWKNTGVAFGMFQGQGWIFTAIGLAVILLIIFSYRQVIDGPKFWRVALGLQLGGAIGNLLDRINPQVGYVVDFIWIGRFPVFNLADVAIVVGALVMLFGIWRQDDSAETRTEVHTSEVEPDGSDVALNRSAAALPELPAFHENSGQ